MIYSKEIMQHFRKPKNIGKMKDYNGLGKIGNLRCGDILWLYIKVDKKGVIKKASFETFGCTVAIANSSLITVMVKGKTIEEALKITKEDILKNLKEVPPIKIHCSVLAVDALTVAIYDYLSKNKMSISRELEEKHKRIKKTEEAMEEKYKEWM